MTHAQPLSLRHNVAWTFVGHVVSAACQWGLVIALAKLGTPEMLGLYALGLADSGPIMMFASLHLRNLQATDSRGEFRFGDYLGLILLSGLFGWLAVIGVACWDGDSPTTVGVIIFVGLGKVFELIANTFHGLSQQHERLDRITKSNVLHGVLSMAALCLVVWQTGSVLWGVIVASAMRLMLIVTFDVPGALWILRSRETSSSTPSDSMFSRWMQIRPRWDRSRLWRLGMLGLPMGVVALLTSLQINVPRYFVEEQMGKAELGIFCAITALMTVGITMMRALDQSCIPRFAKLHAAGRFREFRWMFLKLIAIYLFLGVGGVWMARLFGRELLTILFQAEYASHTDVFETTMQAVVAAYLVGALSSALMAARCIPSQLPMLVLSLLTAIGSCLWLVPEYGLWGASMSMVLCKLPYLLIGSVLLWRTTRLPSAAAVTIVMPNSANLGRAV